MPSRSSAFVTLSSMHDDARSGERRFALYLVTLINIGKSTILKVVHFVYFQIHTWVIDTKWNLTMVWQRSHGWPCTGVCTKIVSGSPLALIVKIWTSSEVWNVLIWKLLSRSELVLAYHIYIRLSLWYHHRLRPCSALMLFASVWSCSPTNLYWRSGQEI